MKNENINSKIYETGYFMCFSGILFLGCMNFLIKDVAITWPRPLPEILQFLNPVMAFTAGAILIIASAFALAKRHIAIASLVIACLIFVLLTSRHLYNRPNPLRAVKSAVYTAITYFKKLSLKLTKQITCTYTKLNHTKQFAYL